MHRIDRRTTKVNSQNFIQILTGSTLTVNQFSKRTENLCLSESTQNFMEFEASSITFIDKSGCPDSADLNIPDDCVWSFLSQKF